VLGLPPITMFRPQQALYRFAGSLLPDVQYLGLRVYLSAARGYVRVSRFDPKG